jgi:hypothetical protein
MRKSQLVARLQNEREEWERVLNYVGMIRFGIGGVSGHWSVRDILAHVLVHEQYLVDRLHEIQQGTFLPACQTQDELDTFLDEFGYPDFESPILPEQQANEWAVIKYRDIPLKDLVDLEIHAYEALHKNIMALNEEQLNEHNLAERLARATYKHYRQHAADIHKRFKTALIR